MLWQQLVEEQKSSAALIDQLDELKRKTEKNEIEFEEFKRLQWEETMKLHEDLLCAISSGNSPSSTTMALMP
jgi:hypothetical protein